MMQHLPLLLACAGEPWALEEHKLRTITQFLLFRAGGGRLSAEEIEARIGTRREQQVARADGQIALLPVYGVMSQRMNMMEEVSGGTSTQMLAAQFREALADPATKAIVFDMDTPGGTSSGTQELADEIFQSRGVKPIIAQINSMAASAGYWMAAAADEIVVTPGGQGGSLGVYTIHDDISKMLEMEGITSTIIRNTASKHKIEANELEPLTDDIRARVQRRVDAAGTRFIRGVATGRGVTEGTVQQRFGQGQMFDADELVDRGMADRVATLPETLERFGLSINPIAAAARANIVSREHQANMIYDRWLKAGEPPTTLDLEHALRELGATRSLGQQAGWLAQKWTELRELSTAKVTVSAAMTDEFRQGFADLRQLLKTG